MRKAVLMATAVASLAGGCAYYPVPPDPIRIIDSPAEVSTCRRLGSTGAPVRTDGRGPFSYSEITTLVPAPGPTGFGAPVGVPAVGVPAGDAHFSQRLNAMRDAAVALGATDLLLVRRRLRDWSYVEGVAYLCPR